MILFYSIGLFIIAAVGYKTEKKILNPITMMSVMWGVIFLFSSLVYYTLFSAKIETYNCMVIGLLFFYFGYYAYVFCSKRKGGRKRICFKIGESKIVNSKINYRLCYVLYCVCILFLLYRVYTYGDRLFSNGLNLKAIGNVIRDDSFSFNDSGLINAVGFLIVSPMYLPLSIVWCIDFIQGKKDKIMMLLMVVMTILRILTTGGRQPIIQIFSALLIVLLFSDLKIIGSTVRNNYKKYKKKIIPISLSGVAVFGALTLSRTTEVVRTIYLDFAMQPYMFEYWTKIIGEDKGYGCVSFFGIIHPFLYLFKNFGFINSFPVFFENIKNSIDLTFSQWIKIGDVLSANAYVSSFWYMFYDGGIAGVIIIMLMWGYISAEAFCRVVNQPTQKNIAYYTIIAIGLIYSFTDFEFSKASYVLGILYISKVLFFRRIKNRSIN